jgi:putative RNA 2'-phosphotransferase
VAQRRQIDQPFRPQRRNTLRQSRSATAAACQRKSALLPSSRAPVSITESIFCRQRQQKNANSERNDWKDLAAEDFAEVIAASSKRRHEMADGRIRALYGQSMPGKLARTASTLPALLYHGTSAKAAEAIRQAGLQRMARQYVHLSNNRADAIEVGRRKHPQPIILVVNAMEAAKAGVAFYVGNDKVRLADRVPWKFFALDG